MSTNIYCLYYFALCNIDTELEDHLRVYFLEEGEFIYIFFLFFPFILESYLKFQMGTETIHEKSVPNSSHTKQFV